MVKEAREDKKTTLADPEQRKKFKSALATVTHYYEQIDRLKDGEKDTIAELSSEYGLDKKIVRKLAKTLYKHNYSSLLEENRSFEILYETCVEGKLRDPDDLSDLSSGDPLDNE